MGTAVERTRVTADDRPVRVSGLADPVLGYARARFVEENPISPKAVMGGKYLAKLLGQPALGETEFPVEVTGEAWRVGFNGRVLGVQVCGGENGNDASQVVMVLSEYTKNGDGSEPSGFPMFLVRHKEGEFDWVYMSLMGIPMGGHVVNVDRKRFPVGKEWGGKTDGELVAVLEGTIFEFLAESVEGWSTRQRWVAETAAVVVAEIESEITVEA